MRDGLLHVRGRSLGLHPVLQQHHLGNDVVELPGKVAQRFIGADARVLADSDLLAIQRQEDVAITFSAAPLGCLGQ